MIGVANKPSGYASQDERLLQTFANQVAVAIDNARLYQHQQTMIDRLQNLNDRLNEAEREKVLAPRPERIAEGLHDEIGQHIFTIGLRLSALIDDASDQIRLWRPASTSCAGSRSRPQSTSAGSFSLWPHRPMYTAP